MTRGGAAAGLLLLVAAPAGAEPVDLNRATVDALDALPSLGPAKAEAWVRWRAEQGPCASLEELEAVPGFGPATVAALRGRAVCGPPPEERPLPPEEPTVGAPVARPVDPNVATVEELARLPGLPEARARAIVEDRERNGPFESCEALVRVPGIGPATVRVLGETCRVSPAP